MRLSLLTVIVFLAGACSVVTPPPMMARHGGAMPGAVGSSDMIVTGFGGGGVFVDSVVGGELRGVSQVTKNLAVGAGLGGAFRLPEEDEGDDHPPDLGLGGRLVAFYNPAGLKWMRVIGGAGWGLTDTGLVYATADAGAVFSYTFFERLTPYAGPTAATSIPLFQGAAVHEGDKPGATGWLGGMAGVELRLALRLYVSAEASILNGWSVRDESAGIFVGSIGLRYHFDPED